MTVPPCSKCHEREPAICLACAAEVARSQIVMATEVERLQDTLALRQQTIDELAGERDGARGQLAELRIEHERLASSVRLANQVAQDQTLSEGELARVRASLDPLRALVATLTAERDSARAELLAEKIALARSLAEVKEMAERLAAKHGNIEGANFDLRAALRACLDELKANEIWPGWADRAEDLLR